MWQGEIRHFTSNENYKHFCKKLGKRALVISPLIYRFTELLVKLQQKHYLNQYNSRD